jgi:hypothetical protein
VPQRRRSTPNAACASRATRVVSLNTTARVPGEKEGTLPMQAYPSPRAPATPDRFGRSSESDRPPRRSPAPARAIQMSRKRSPRSKPGGRSSNRGPLTPLALECDRARRRPCAVGSRAKQASRSRGCKSRRSDSARRPLPRASPCSAAASTAPSRTCARRQHDRATEDGGERVIVVSLGALS